MSGFLLKPFVVEVQGFGAWPYPAASRGKALAEAWRDFSNLRDNATFKDFLRIAKVWRSGAAPRFGEPITVGGRPAFYVGERGQYIRFARPGETATFLSHPADVCAASVDRNPEGRDGEARLGAEHESAVTATGGQTPNPGSDRQ
jgi:hypothetical protein